MTLLTWMGEHPILTLFLGILAAGTITEAARAISSAIYGQPTQVPCDCACTCSCQCGKLKWRNEDQCEQTKEPE